MLQTLTLLWLLVVVVAVKGHTPSETDDVVTQEKLSERAHRISRAAGFAANAPAVANPVSKIVDKAAAGAKFVATNAIAAAKTVVENAKDAAHKIAEAIQQKAKALLSFFGRKRRSVYTVPSARKRSDQGMIDGKRIKGAGLTEELLSTAHRNHPITGNLTKETTTNGSLSSVRRI